jgi:precorrin-6B methylase 2
MLNAAGNREHGYCTGALALPPAIMHRAARIAAVDRRHRVLGTNRLLLGSGAMVR